MVDGKTYWRIKKQERDRQQTAVETAATVLVILEEEFVDMFGGIDDGKSYSLRTGLFRMGSDSINAGL